MVWQAGLGAVLRVKFWFGTASQGTVRRGRHVAVRQGLLWKGETEQVEVWQAGSVKVCRVESRHGVAGKVGQGMSACGLFRSGAEGLGRQGRAGNPLTKQ